MSLTYLSQPVEYQQKEQLYLEVRRREGRILTDEQLRELPEVKHPPALAQEWLWRKRSFQRLDAYINRRPPQTLTRILDVGCGNGWMSNLLAKNLVRAVTAVDLNEHELEQGSRVFRRHNLRFVYGNPLESVLPERSFEIIVLAASVQYFPHLPELIATLKKLLAINGEIHMLDSNFYADEEAVAAAKKRTETYYDQVGVSEMAGFYHHHLWKEAQELGAVDLNGGLGVSLLRRLKYLGPFPWLRIR